MKCSVARLCSLQTTSHCVFKLFRLPDKQHESALKCKRCEADESSISFTLHNSKAVILLEQGLCFTPCLPSCNYPVMRTFGPAFGRSNTSQETLRISAQVDCFRLVPTYFSAIREKATVCLHTHQETNKCTMMKTTHVFLVVRVYVTAVTLWR